MKGRALLNAVGNLQLSGPYAEALRKLGYSLEDVANQVFSYYRSNLFVVFLLLLETTKSFKSLLFCLSASHSGM